MKILNKSFYCKGLKIGFKGSLLKIDVLEDEKIREKCKICENYGKNYSCPPYAPTTKFFKKKYKKIFAYIFHMKNGNVDKWEALARLVFEYGKKLEKVLDGECLIAGNCKVCVRCSLETGKPCIHPRKKRYSFTGVGLNSEKLSKILNHKIVWNKKYLSAVGGCFTNKEKINFKEIFDTFEFIFKNEAKFFQKLKFNPPP